jgi:hypothetical protein
MNHAIHMKNTCFVTNKGVTKKRTLNGSEKFGICKNWLFLSISTEATEAGTFEGIQFTANIGHECSSTHSRKG